MEEPQLWSVCVLVSALVLSFGVAIYKLEAEDSTEPALVSIAYPKCSVQHLFLLLGSWCV